MEGFLSQAVIYLSAAVIAVPIASRMGLGSVLGYLAAGIIIGPVLGLVGSETADLQHFAEFGVVMMLFVIGLELEPRALWDMRHKLLGLGGLQITCTIAGDWWGCFCLWAGVAICIGHWDDPIPVLNRDCSTNPKRKRIDADTRWALKFFGFANARHRRDSNVGNGSSFGTAICGSHA
jgi:hypothetical protein